MNPYISSAILLLAIAWQPNNAWAVNWNWLDKAPVQAFGERDWELLRHTLRNALDTLPDGASSEWENPQSGNGGSIILLKSEHQAMRYCRSVEIRNRSADQSGSNRSRLCRQDDGSWKISR